VAVLLPTCYFKLDTEPSKFTRYSKIRGLIQKVGVLGNFSTAPVNFSLETEKNIIKQKATDLISQETLGLPS
jgi:hypothetical protein